MHPILSKLFLPISTLKGVGDKRIELLHRLGCYNIRDALFHIPYERIDRRASPPLTNLIEGQIITTVVQIDELGAHTRYKKPFKIACSNETGDLMLVYFNINKKFIEQNFKVGNKLAISGKVSFPANNHATIVHPDVITSADNIQRIKRIESVYPTTYGLHARSLSLIIADAVSYMPTLPEWIDHKMLLEHKWPSFKEAISKLHLPQNENEIAVGSPLYQRLVFDELLAHQLQLAMARSAIKRITKEPLKSGRTLAYKLISILPYQLTNAQVRVIDEIFIDQESNVKMFRLVQGDVGCGKTLVALFAMLNTIEGGKQATIMVPTEVLARQHFQKLQEFTEKLGIKVRLLISNLKASEKTAILQELESGEIDILIGTHAIFQEKVVFKNLGLAVVDEQHRFGVEQRLSLTNKGHNVDFLMMTATPIPRTTAMVNYGDMDISIIDEKPKGRMEIETKIITLNKVADLLTSLTHKIQNNEQIFWVCPLIEESEKVDLANASARFEGLNKHFPGKVAMIHGRMKAQERDAILTRFAEGELQLLVSTTIIEVGIDIPNATVMVIENAERFGLAQLHQLRGRVGRGDKKSYCMLLTKPYLAPESFQRLNVLKNSNDGFYISEQDLKIRGIGDLMGNKQSGLPTFKFFNIEEHQSIVEQAQKYAKKIIKDDPNLEKETSKNLRILLQLFDANTSEKLVA